MSHEQPEVSTTPKRSTFNGPASPPRPSIGARAVPLHIPSSPTRAVHPAAPASHQPTVRPSTDSDRTLGHVTKSYPESESRSSDLERPPTTPLGTPTMMYKPRLSTSGNATNSVGSRTRPLPANLRIRVQPRFPSSPGHSPTTNAFPSQPSSAYASQPSSAIGSGSIPSSLTGSGMSTPLTFSRSPSPDPPLPSAIPFPMLEVEPLCSCFDTQCSCGSNANTPVTVTFPSLATMPTVATVVAHPGFPLQPSSRSPISSTELPRPGPRSTPVSPLAVSKPLPLLPVATKSPKKTKRPATSREGEGSSSPFGSRIFSKILKPSKSAHELQSYSQNPAHRSTPTHKLSSPSSPADKRTSKTKRTSKGTSPARETVGSGPSSPLPHPTRVRTGTDASHKDIETNTRLADIDFSKTGLASANLKLAEMQALGLGLGLRGPMSTSVLPLSSEGQFTGRERSFSASATSLRSSAQASPRSTTGSLAEKAGAATVNARFDHLPPSPLLSQAISGFGPSSPKFPEKMPEAMKPSKLSELLHESELPPPSAPPGPLVAAPIGAEAALPSTAAGSHQQLNSAPPSPSPSVKRVPKSQSKSRMRSGSVSTSQGGNHSRPPSRLQSPAQSRVHSPIQSIRALPSSSQIRLDSPLQVQLSSDGGLNGSVPSLTQAKFALLEIESKDESSASGSHDHSYYPHDVASNSHHHLPTDPGSARTSFESSHPVAAQVLAATPARTMSRWERVRARVDSLGAGLRGRKQSRVSDVSQGGPGGEILDIGLKAGGEGIQPPLPVRERRDSNASQREKSELAGDEMPIEARRSASKPRSKPRISSSRSRKSSMVAIHPQLPAHPEAPMPPRSTDEMVTPEPQEEGESQNNSIPEVPDVEAFAVAEDAPVETPAVTTPDVGTTDVVAAEHPPTPTTPQNALFSETVDLTETPRNLVIRTSVKSLTRHISVTPATPEAIAFPSMSFEPEDPTLAFLDPLDEPPRPTIPAPTCSSSLNSPSSASASPSPQFATYNLGVDSDDLFSPFDSQLHTPLDLQLHLPITEEQDEEADICEDNSEIASLPSSPSALTFKLPPPPPKRYDALTSYVMQTVPGWEPEMLMWEQRLDDPLYYAPSTNETTTEKETEQSRSPRATPRSSLAGSRVSRSSISSQEIKSRVMGTSVAHSMSSTSPISSPISSPRQSLTAASKEIDNDETIRARRRGRAHTLIGAVTRSVANSASAINLLTPTSSSPMPISSPTYYSPVRRPRTSTGSGPSIIANSGLHPLEALQREPEITSPKHLTPGFGDSRAGRTHSFSSAATGSSSVSSRFRRFLDKVTARDRH